MSFNLDDPLADILSDGSDDSFFDDDILGKKKPTAKSVTTVQKKNDLFDLGEEKKGKPDSNVLERKNSLFDLTDSNTNKEFPIAKQKTPTPFRRSLSKEIVDDIEKDVPKALDRGKIPEKTATTNDKLDFLDEFVGPKKDGKKPLERGKSSQSLLDDILGETVPSKGIASAQKTITSDKILATDTKSTNIESRSSFTKPKERPPKEDHKPLKTDEKKPTTSKKSSDDWLGLFKEEDEDITDDPGMPAWLAGDTTKKKTKKPAPVDEKPEKQTEPTVITTTEFQGLGILDNNAQIPIPTYQNLQIQSGIKEDVTAEGAALCFQQQESQLMVAMQLKAQEEKLAAMQQRQEETARVHREVARASRQQVEALLSRQAEQRRQMQDVIAAHQERITQRIKAMLAPVKEVDDEESVEHHKDDRGETKETPYSKEKKQLLQLVQSLQENHDKEIDLMETSYRRQLAFVEVSLHQAEERMKEESDKITKFYTEKLSWLEEHHHLYRKLTEDNLHDLSVRHKHENEMLRQQHMDNIKMLQEHHVALMENIKNAVQNEQTLIKDSATFSGNLVELVADVKESKKYCGELLEKVNKIAETSNRDVEVSLQARDRQLTELSERLKKEREIFELEKTDSRDVMKALEGRLKQITALMEEESATMKQKRMEFEFEKATFAKQTEFAKNLLKKQDEEIKAIREEIEKEYQEKIKRIEEEKTKAQKDSLAASKEKSSAHNLKQDLEKMKAELQMQLEEVYEEKSKLSLEKQQMHMEEQRITAKSRDLDLLAKASMERQAQADKKHADAEIMQRKYEERLKIMQDHVVSLNNREKQIAREKVALSRERLNIHTERKQLEGLQHCSLCKTSQNVPIYSNYEPNHNISRSFMGVSKDFGNINQNVARNELEAEMATLMTNNFENDVDSPIENRRYDDIEGHSSFHSSYMDPKFMMLRLDVQKVLSNLQNTKKTDEDEARDGVNS